MCKLFLYNSLSSTGRQRSVVRHDGFVVKDMNYIRQLHYFQAYSQLCVKRLSMNISVFVLYYTQTRCFFQGKFLKEYISSELRNVLAQSGTQRGRQIQWSSFDCPSLLLSGCVFAIKSSKYISMGTKRTLWSHLMKMYKHFVLSMICGRQNWKWLEWLPFQNLEDYLEDTDSLTFRNGHNTIGSLIRSLCLRMKKYFPDINSVSYEWMHKKLMKGSQVKVVLQVGMKGRHRTTTH